MDDEQGLMFKLVDSYQEREYDPYIELANAIIIQAVDDFQDSQKEIEICKRKRGDESKKKLKKATKLNDEVRSFFLSEWFINLSGLRIDGDVLMGMLSKSA